MQKKMIPAIIATKATRPIVRPTAPPVDKPPLLFETDDLFDSLGGAVGVTVTVRTCPVMVSRDTIGVGVHVELVELDVVDIWAATVVCFVVEEVVGATEELVDVVFYSGWN